MKLTLKTDLDLADNLELVTNIRYAHVKYEGPNSLSINRYGQCKKICGKTDKRTHQQTDGPKNIYAPPPPHLFKSTLH